MYTCKQCKRYYKSKVYTCPVCRNDQIEKISDSIKGEFNTPPDGGYIVNLKDYNYEKKDGTTTLGIGLIFALFVIYCFYGELNITSFGILSLIIIFLEMISIGFSAWCIITGLLTIKKSRDSKRKVEVLSKEGILIKGLPYTKEKVGHSFATVSPIEVYRIRVFYKNHEGLEFNYYSNNKQNDDDELLSSYRTADLLIDPNDCSNYFVDFEIY